MMAKRFPHHGLLALCSLALPAAAVAQDASIGTGQDDSDQTQGDSGFGNMGSMTTETTTTGSSHSQARSHGSDVEVDIGRPDNRGDDWAMTATAVARRSTTVICSATGRWARRTAAAARSR